MIKSICIVSTTGLLMLSQYAFARNPEPGIEKVDLVMLYMREAESKYIALMDYYQIHTSRKGRKMKIKGFNDKTTRVLISKEKIIVSKKGSNFRRALYYKYDPSMSTFTLDLVKVFRKTEGNGKLVSAKFYLPDNRIQYVLVVDGNYFQLDNRKAQSPGIKY